MKLRKGHIIVTILVIAGVFIVVAAVRATRSTPPPADPTEQFLTEVRSELATLPATPQGSGDIPPVQNDLSNAPRIEVDTTHFDTGIIANTTPTTLQMPVYNRGKSDLVIAKVKTSCGCTKGEMKQTTIPPGEQSPLMITVDPMKIGGGFETTKTLTIESNDPANPMLQVQVTSHVEPEVSVEPKELDFGTIDKGKTSEGTVIIRQLTDEPLVIEELINSRNEEGINISYEEIPQDQWAKPEHREYKVIATLGPETPVGKHQLNFSLRTSLKRLKQIRIMLKAEIQAFYAVENRNVAIGMITPGEKRPKVAKITADRPFEVVNIQSPEEITVTARSGEEPNTVLFDVAVNDSIPDGHKKWQVKFDIKAGTETFSELVNMNGMVRGDPASPMPLPVQPPAPTTSAPPPAKQ